MRIGTTQHRKARPRHNRCRYQQHEAAEAVSNQFAYAVHDESDASCREQSQMSPALLLSWLTFSRMRLDRWTFPMRLMMARRGSTLTCATVRRLSVIRSTSCASRGRVRERQGPKTTCSLTSAELHFPILSRPTGCPHILRSGRKRLSKAFGPRLWSISHRGSDRFAVNSKLHP
jgi:hypothetical protein